MFDFLKDEKFSLQNTLKGFTYLINLQICENFVTNQTTNNQVKYYFRNNSLSESDFLEFDDEILEEDEEDSPKSSSKLIPIPRASKHSIASSHQSDKKNHQILNSGEFENPDQLSF